MLNMQNNISNFLLLSEVREASYLYLLCHLCFQLIIHSPIMYWTLGLHQALWEVTGSTKMTNHTMRGKAHVVKGFISSY